MLIDEIRPKKKVTVMSALQQLGYDVSDWGNYKNGKNNPAANPSYCYEWAFHSGGKYVVLNLWLEEMREQEGTLIREIFFDDLIPSAGTKIQRSIWGKRANKMIAAIRVAAEQNLPVRVIISDGVRRDFSTGAASSVKWRALDSRAWTVTLFDDGTRRAVLTRDGTEIPAQEARQHFADQFDPDVIASDSVATREAVRREFVRDAHVRDCALVRANGHCEYCGERGFEMVDGRRYLETHDVVALCDGGQDSLSNVAVLCPNDHRLAHFGREREAMRVNLQKVVATKMASIQREHKGFPDVT